MLKKTKQRVSEKAKERRAQQEREEEIEIV